MSKRAAIYMRVASVPQADPESAFAEPKKALTAYCEHHGWRIVAEYADLPASGMSNDRPNFQRMMEAAERGIPSFAVVVVHNLSQFSKDMALAARYRRKLHEAGVELVSMTEDLSESANLVYQIKALFDQYEAKERSMRIKRALAEKKRRKEAS